VSIDGISHTARSLVVLTDGDAVQFSAGESGARLLLVAARPLNEPILQYRSFVMNTPEDIRETLEMIEAGTFAK
jgi:redox-sensitive bicupin YhaK (pirin superfamily)